MSRSIARARAGRDRASLYQEITDKIIAELEAGRVPWVQPWGTAAGQSVAQHAEERGNASPLFGDQCATALDSKIDGRRNTH
jgi:antirestriction factor ArdC-like protein